MKCLICDKEFKSVKGLLLHVNMSHKLTTENYYCLGHIRPKCTCGKFTSFIDYKLGYRKYCSAKCAANNEQTKQKRINTNLNKYGCKNISQVDSIKQQKLETYKLHIDENKAKIKSHNQQKYGCDWITQTNEFKQKSKETCMKKYNVDNYAKSKAWLNKLKAKYEEDHRLYTKLGYVPTQELFIKYGTGWYQAKIVPTILYKHKSYVEEKYISTIQEYSCKNMSKLESTVLDYVKSIYNKKIISHTRKVIAPYELDIYMPDIRLAIEVNGTWYHSIENNCPKDYHLKKALLCKDQNIRLLHLYEFDMKDFEDKINKAMSGYNIVHTKSILVHDRYDIYCTDQKIMEGSD